MHLPFFGMDYKSNPRKEVHSMNRHKSLVVQDSLGSPSPTKIQWRKRIFKVLFKVIEVLLMILQIISMVKDFFR